MYYEFIESSVFSSNLHDCLSDDEYADLQRYLSEFPKSGDVVKGSGGVRKLRWARRGMGKQGGVRVCYYFRARHGQILMLTIYSKNVQDSIPAHILKLICKEFEDE